MTLISKPRMVKGAGNIATAVITFFIGAQLLLAAGLLPITIFWGGRQSELTPGLRLASIAAVFILTGFIYIIRRRAGLIDAAPAGKGIRILAWLITLYMLLNTLGNLASTSGVEKLLFAPLTFSIALACLVVAASRARN